MNEKEICRGLRRLNNEKSELELKIHKLNKEKESVEFEIKLLNLIRKNPNKINEHLKRIKTNCKKKGVS